MVYIKSNLSSRDILIINESNSIINCAFRIVYTLSIVRGYKTIVRYLPHEVTDLEPTLMYLLAIDQNKLTLWHARYVLCIWLSIIVRVPFDLNSIDSFGDMIDNIINTVKIYLQRSEKSREGAAVLISRLFSRPDFEQTHMKQFFSWCLDKLEKLREENNIFLFTGIFRTLAEIFKHAHRDALLPNAPLILERYVFDGVYSFCSFWQTIFFFFFVVFFFRCYKVQEKCGVQIKVVWLENTRQN